jgi:hypothetical protein
MKRIIIGLVAVVALAWIPAVAEAGHPNYHRGGRNSWNSGYRGGWDRDHCHHHHSPRVVYRPPVRVYRPIYPVYGYGSSSFYYNSPNASFGFGF